MKKKHSAPHADWGAGAAILAWPNLTAAQRRIWMFCSWVRSGCPEPAPRDAMLELVEGFERYATGTEPDLRKALGVYRGRGAGRRIKHNEKWRRIRIATTVLDEKRRRENLRRRYAGRLSVEQVCRDVGPAFKVSSSFAKDCYEAFRRDAELVLEWYQTQSVDVSRAADILRELTERHDGCLNFSPPLKINTPRK